jgi:two-component system cell cycle response regulator
LKNEGLSARVLLADDDAMIQAVVGTALANGGHDVVLARNGREALSVIRREKDKIDVILLDRHMPGFGGLDIVRELQADPALRHIPIVMQTSADSADEIREGLDAGVFYYLTKPFSNDVLQSIVNSAARSMRRHRELQGETLLRLSGFGLLETATFSFRTLDETEGLALFAANCFPEPSRVLAGLYELLVNALEHGNLGIGYALKTQLVAERRWHSEIARRESLPENQDKSATLMITRDQKGVCARISDQGSGFDTAMFMRLDPSRAYDSHGRGIAKTAVTSFDSIAYNDKGNSVSATVFLNADQT